MLLTNYKNIFYNLNTVVAENELKIIKHVLLGCSQGHDAVLLSIRVLLACFGGGNILQHNLDEQF